MLIVNISNFAINTVKMLIIDALFITLANLKELIYEKIVLNFSLFKTVFYLACLVSIKWLIV